MNKLLILAIAALCFLTPLTAQDLSEIYEKVSPSVVAIFTEEKTIMTTKNNETESVTSNGLGTGFMISELPQRQMHLPGTGWPRLRWEDRALPEQ